MVYPETAIERRREVARRLARSYEYDAKNCTSVYKEFFALLFNGCTGVCNWSDEQVEEYLNTHDSNGVSWDLA